MQTDVLDKLRYADDLTENVISKITMQGAADRMSKARDNFHLIISIKRLRPASTWKAVQRTNHHIEWTKNASC